MKRILIILFTLYGVLFPLNVFSKDDIPSGREFWVVYPRALSVSDSITLFIVGDTSCTGYLENTFLNYHVSFVVDAGNVTRIVVPFSVVGTSFPDGPINNPAIAQSLDYHQNGLFLHASKNVCVYVSSASTLLSSHSNSSPKQCGDPPLPYSPIETSLSNMSYKTPLYPLHFSVSEHLDMDYDMFWYFQN